MAIWEKLFSKITFKDYPDTSTPLNATNLNKMTDAIDGIDNRVVELKSDLKWKSINQGVITGKTEISLPSEFEEIEVKVQINNGTNYFSHVFRVSYSQLASASVNEYHESGHYRSENNCSYFSIMMNKVKVQLNAVYFRGTDYTDSAVVQVFYR